MALSRLDELLIATRTPAKACPVCDIGEEYRDAMERAYDEHGIGAYRLLRAVRMWGLEHLTEWKIQRHLDRRCGRPSTTS